MPYASSEGARIHYQLEGAGPPLILQHGYTASVEDWYEFGYVDALKHNYRLILVSARGHGGSDKPHEPEAYPLGTRAGDVVAVLDALAIEKAHYWGHSMGGWIGFGMAEFAPERVDRLVIGAAHPYARDQAGFRQLMQTGITNGQDAFVAAFERMAGAVPPGYKARLHKADLKALLAAAGDRPSIEGVLPKMRMPCCLYAGESDPMFAEIKSAGGLIRHATFFSLPGVSHLQSFIRSDLVLPRVIEFLGERDR
jgi:pimeloyl-ACP methyl ester carboxylesterase